LDSFKLNNYEIAMINKTPTGMNISLHGYSI
jgi:hypothetical protein